jgi:arylsulfatase A-like enzyme
MPVPAPGELLTESAPTFALIHYLPPHMPYDPPQPFAGMYSAWANGDYAVDSQILDSYQRGSSPEEMAPEQLRFIRDSYDETVAYADALVGRLVEMLKREGRYDDPDAL